MPARVTEQGVPPLFSPSGSPQIVHRHPQITRDIRTPNKADIGKAVAKDTAAANADVAEKLPTVPDLLVTLLPTGIVAAYSAVITVVAGLLPDATAAEPNPPEHLGPRFTLLLLMICFVAGWTWRD